MTTAARDRSTLVGVLTFGAFMVLSLWKDGVSTRGLGLTMLALAALFLARRGPFTCVVAIIGFVASWFSSPIVGTTILALTWWLGRSRGPIRAQFPRQHSGPVPASQHPDAPPEPAPPTPDELEQELRKTLGERWPVAAVDHPDPEVCRRGVVALARTPGGPPVRLMESVLRHAKSERFGSARLAAAKALGVPGLVEAIPALLSVLETDDRIQEAAARALRRIGDPAVCERLVPLYARSDWLLAREITEALRHFGDQAVPSVIAGARSALPLVRSRCALALGRMGHQDAAPLLTEALADAATEVRAAAATALGQLQAKEARGALESALRDSRASVRAAAARALGRIRDPASVEALVDLLSKEKVDDVVREAIEALGLLGDSRAVCVLGGLFHQMGLRVEVTEALVRIGGDQARAAARRFLKNRDFATRLAAIQTVAALRDDAAIRPLRDVQKLRDDELASAAGEALEQIAGTPDAPKAPTTEVEAFRLIASLPELSWYERRRVIETLVRRGPEVAGALAEGLDRAEPLVRWWRVEALRRLGGVEAQRILGRIAKDDPDERVRRRASAAV